MRCTSRARAFALLLAAVLASACAGHSGPDAATQASVEALRELRHEQDERRAATDTLVAEPAPTFASRMREGDELRASGQHGKALWAYLQAGRLEPSSPEPTLRIATLHLNVEPKRAEEIFREIVKQYPESADAYAGLGVALLAQGERSAAQDMLRLAIELDPRHAPALNALGVALDQAGQHVEARALLNRAWSIQPRSHVALNNLGSSYLATGEFAEAASVLQQAEQLEPRDFAVKNNLGLALARLGKEQAALAKFREAGSDQAAYNNMGYAAYLDQKYDRALDWYERALLEEGPLAPQIRLNIIDAVAASRSSLRTQEGDPEKP